MIGPPGAVRVLVATRPVDFRKGSEGLAALVKEQMRADPFSGAIFVFRAKRADRIKLIFWAGTGLCLYAKRLEDGEFRWPKVQQVEAAQAAEIETTDPQRRAATAAKRRANRGSLPEHLPRIETIVDIEDKTVSGALSPPFSA